MHPLAKLALAAALLMVTIAAALHPSVDVLTANPLACVGVALIGVGLMRQYGTSATQ